jgi:hypothetical protein
MPRIIGERWMEISMLELLVLGLLGPILAFAMLSVEKFDPTVSLPEQPPISWEE